MTPLLELCGVSKTYRRPDGQFVHAVVDVHLTVGSRETVALVGESGSGKSTLGRLALFLTQPDSGLVRFQGVDLCQLPPTAFRERRVQLQPIFQDAAASLNPRRRVEFLMRQAMRDDRSSDKTTDVVRFLEEVGLKPAERFLRRFPHQLSGGQKQRLAIARALAVRPSLIVADEPLSGADVSTRGQILNLLSHIQHHEGVAYLLITHDILLARAFADRIAVMKDGRVVESGPAATVVDSPAHPYTRALVAAVPVLKRLAPQRQAMGEVIVNP